MILSFLKLHIKLTSQNCRGHIKGKETVYSTFDKKYHLVVCGEDNVEYTLNGERCSQEAGKKLLNAIKRSRPVKNKPIIVKNDSNKHKKEKKNKKKPGSAYISIQQLELQKLKKKSRKDKKEYTPKVAEKIDEVVKEYKEERDLGSIGYKDFLVRRSTFSCWNKNHHTKDLIATVYVLNKNPEKNDKREININAGY